MSVLERTLVKQIMSHYLAGQDQQLYKQCKKQNENFAKNLLADFYQTDVKFFSQKKLLNSLHTTFFYHTQANKK